MSFNNRPNTPAESQFFLKMVTENEVDKQTIKTFYSTVSTYAPQNTLSIYETSSPDGEPAQATLVHRVIEDGGHEYEVPLVRNLTANEIFEVMNQLENALSENDFLLETSSFDEECCLNEEHDDLYFEDSLTEQLSSRFAERAHENWLNERMSKGWRYGETRNDEQKTHPLLKPWSQLSEEHRAVDSDAPQLLLDIFADYGYVMISESELEDLLHRAEKNDRKTTKFF